MKSLKGIAIAAALSLIFVASAFAIDVEIVGYESAVQNIPANPNFEANMATAESAIVNKNTAEEAMAGNSISDEAAVDLDGDLDGDDIPNWDDPDIDGDGIENHSDADDWDPNNTDIIAEIDTNGDGIIDTEIIIPDEIATMEPDITVLEVPELPEHDPVVDEPDDEPITEESHCEPPPEVIYPYVEYDPDPNDGMPCIEPEDPGDNMPCIDPEDPDDDDDDMDYDDPPPQIV